MLNKPDNLSVLSLESYQYGRVLKEWCRNCATAPACVGCTIKSYDNIQHLPEVANTPSKFKPKNDEENQTALPSARHTDDTLGLLGRIARSQDVYGYQKYGKMLDPFDQKYDWLLMALEESADMNKYIVADLRKRDAVVARVVAQLQAWIAVIENEDATSMGFKIVSIDPTSMCADMHSMIHALRTLSKANNPDMQGTTKGQV